jgi:hypothetical protein
MESSRANDSLVDFLDTATLENTKAYKLSGEQRVKILEIFEDNPCYMTVALVHSETLYQCDVWTPRGRNNALRIGEIVIMDFLDFMEGSCGICSCIYEVLMPSI